MKVMTVFFDLDGIMRAEFVPRTVNSEYYKGLLESLMMCVENDLKNGQTVSSSIMTTLRVTPPLVWQFLSNKYITVSSSTLFTGSGTVRFLALLQSQNDHER